MNKKNPSDYKRKYDISRHHAWAGSILLSVVLAVRIFLEMSDIKDIPDKIILPIGIILVLYILISLFFTYKYRSGLNTEQKNIIDINIKSDDLEKKKIDADLEKERLKIEKKKAKAQVKSEKKKQKN